MMNDATERSLARPRQSSDVNEVYKALAQAQQQAQAVVKAARNEWHKYSYASAEAMLREAKEAMQNCGLAITRIDMRSVQFHDLDGILLLEAVYRVAHESGQFFDVESCLPFQLEKGRPWDKAILGAQTTCLSYTVRDLLMLPRVAEDEDVPARNDTDYKPAPPKQRVNFTDVGSVKRAVTISLRKRGVENSGIVQMIDEYVDFCGVTDFNALNASQMQHLVRACEEGANPSTGEAIGQPGEGGSEFGKFNPPKVAADSDRPAATPEEPKPEKASQVRQPEPEPETKNIDDRVAKQFKRICTAFVNANPDADPDECHRVAAVRINDEYGGPWFTQPVDILTGIVMAAEGGVMDLRLETD